MAKAKDKHGEGKLEHSHIKLTYLALPVTVEDNKDGTYDVVVAVPVDDDAVPVTLSVGLTNGMENMRRADLTIIRSWFSSSWRRSNFSALPRNSVYHTSRYKRRQRSPRYSGLFIA